MEESENLSKLFVEMFMRSDKPTTCAKCGCRTDIIMDLSHTKEQMQVHECLNSNCKHIFVEVRDDEF